MKRNGHVWALSCAVLICFGYAAGADREWTGIVNDDWFIPGNWTPSGVPQPTEDLLIDGGYPVAYERVGVDGGSIVFDNESSARFYAALAPVVGDGLLAVRDGSSLYVDYVEGYPVTVGVYNGSTGTIEVSTSNWWMTHAHFAGGVSLGGGEGSLGRLNVSGAGASVVVDRMFYIGSFGQGEVNILNGGAIEMDPLAITMIGGGHTGQATVIVSGQDSDAPSRWNVNGDLQVGGLIGGSAELYVGNGAEGDVYVGGTMTLGPGGYVQVYGGMLQANTINNTAGGLIEIKGSSIDVDTFYLGGNSVFSYTGGSLTFDLLEMSGGTFDAPDQTLALGPGQIVNLSGGELRIGFIDTSGGGTFVHDGGTLTYGENGGLLGGGGLDNLLINGENNPTLVYNHTVSGETYLDIIIGQDKKGTLVLQNGAVVFAKEDLELQRGNISIAAEEGSMGCVTVTGTYASTGEASKLSAENNIYVGGSSAGPGGTGELSIDVGGMVEVGDELVIYGGGTVNLSGGEINADGIHLAQDGAAFNVTAGTFSFDVLTVSGGTYNSPTGWINVADGSVNLAGGTMKVGQITDSLGNFAFTAGRLEIGAFVGNLTVGGTLAPGLSPGKTVVTGDLMFGGGGDQTIEIELAGLVRETEYDFVDVQGTLYPEYGTLKVMLIEPFMPSLGDSFDILDWVSISGAFDDVILPSLDGGLTWSVDYLYTDGVIEVIPEPATMGLLAVGAVGLVCRRRRATRIV